MKVFSLLCLFAVAFPAASVTSVSKPAQRIVSLAPHLTELVYTAGAGDKLVGVEAHSDYPSQARALPRVGDAFQVDFERLLVLKPDLVLVWDSGTPEPVIEKLNRLGLRVQRVSISRLEQIAYALRTIGELAGTATVAEQAAKKYLGEIAALRKSRGQATEVTVFYQISEKPLYTVNGRHLISEAIELCGGKNIFADLAQLAPPIGMEAVIERDPEVILAGDGAQGDPLSVWRKWPQMRAVRQGNLYTVRADSIARSTPRVVDGVRQVCAILDKVRARPPTPVTQPYKDR